MIIGFVWLVSFTLSFHQFIISSYTSIWYKEEEEESPAHDPLGRSFQISYYNFGSIALDAIVYPVVFFIMVIYSMMKTNAAPSDE